MPIGATMKRRPSGGLGASETQTSSMKILKPMLPSSSVHVMVNLQWKIG